MFIKFRIKFKIKKFVKNIQKKIKRLWLYLKQEKKFISEEYFVLAPVDSAEKSENFNAMDFALDKKHKNIHNIAITGPYGSGKSSFWESYKKQKKSEGKLPFKEKELLEISLAKFTEQREDCNCNHILKGQKEIYVNNYNSDCINDKDKEEFEIERGILQQIIFSVESNKIPKSKSKKVMDLPIWLEFGFGIIFLTIYGLLINDGIEKIIAVCSNWTESILYTSIIITVIAFLLSITFSFIAIAFLRLINYIYPIKLSKITIPKIEFSFCEQHGSLINQNLTEIIYFFEKTGKKIVVFEDIDRNKTNAIFSKLRELNRILNNSPKLKNKIKFIYMVRDDILQKYERTKFFDFIIPVVPILNGDNATSYIKTHFLREEYFPFDDDKPFLSLAYLEDIQKYLDDLRLIKNCFNELKIYKEVNKHFHGEKGDEKLFSLILYKNLYPKDFQNLLRQRGVLHYCLNKSSKDLEEEMIKKNNEIKEA